MNLENKKELAKKVLGVGKNRIVFSSEGLNEIKEAITKQDIRTLYEEGIIMIKPVKGRRTVVKRKTRKGPGKVRKTVHHRKQIYVKTTRKLRAYVKQLKNSGKIERPVYKDLRNKIRIRYFKNQNHLKDYLENEMKLTIRGESMKVDVKKTKGEIKPKPKVSEKQNNAQTKNVKQESKQ